jgi:lysyl endopeptidase
MISKTLRAAAALISVLLAASASAQRMEPGYAPEARALAVAPTLHDIPFTELTLAPIDAASVASVREANARPGVKALQVGIGRDFVPLAAADLEWTQVDGRWVAQWRVTSPGAIGLRVALEGAADPAVTAVFADDTGGTFGPFHPASEPGSPYWSPVLEGETATIELRSTSPERPALSLVQASHLLASPRQADVDSFLKASASCEVDLVCRAATDSGLAAAGTSIARMVFSSGANSYLCTGTLLNSTGGSFAPFFYTAAHCISTQASASSLTTFWFYERTTCGGSTTSSQFTQVPGGAQLLYADPTVSDVSFLRLNGTPPAGVQFAGWDASPMTVNTAITAIHHPAGDVKKVSLGTTHGFTYVTGNGLPQQGTFIDVTWNSGVTEGGSSGSGLFSKSGGTYYHRGGLLGGSSSCASPGNDDVYSRFDVAYPNIAAWLNPPPPPQYALAVTRAGTGLGTVTSTPAAINCGATCGAQVNSGAALTLVAESAPGSTFAGWTGACTGTGACVVTMSAARSVTATFVTSAPVLSVSASNVPFGGQLLNAVSVQQPIVVSNTGGGILSLQGFAVTAPFEVVNSCALIAAGGSCTLLLDFAPRATGTVSGRLDISTDAGSASVDLSGTGQTSLVDGYYRSILGRPADPAGLAFWDQQALDLAAAGGNINEVWYALAIGFFNSDEYLAYHHDDAQFVTDLYNTFFQRVPDAPGLQYWVGLLQSGLPRNAVLVSFLFTPEFSSFTQALYGNTAARPEVDVVMDFYRGLLSRVADTGGLAFWVQSFRVAQCQGSAAVVAQVEAISSAFALGTEYTARNRSNSEYVVDLYNAFMRRGADLGGVQYWTGLLASGQQTREQVRRQFIASAEFQARVSAVFAAGCTAQARRLVGGTWTFDALLGATPLATTMSFSSVPSSATAAPATWTAFGSDATGARVTGSYAPETQLWTVRAPASGFDALYVFGFDSDNHVTGCYYRVAPGGPPSSACSAMTGRR